MDEDLRYIHHFGLIVPPFQGIPDRRFIWLGEKQLETLAHLKVGIEDGKGVLLLLGDEGSGKSVLVGCLLKIVAGEIATAILREARISVDRFFNFLAAEFKIDKGISTKGDFLTHFRTFLLAACSQGRKVLLVVEDAQNQDDEILEQVRLFSNMEEKSEKLLSVLLVGDSELKERLMEHRHRALLQRAAVRCRTDPFSTKETDLYIRHRMMVAGSFLEIFTSEAVEAIRHFSGGIPKAIDLICDHALMRGYFEKRRTIDAKLLTRYAKEAQKTFRLEKGAGLSFEGAARLKAEAANTGKSRFHKSTSIWIGLAVFLFLTAGISYLNFHEEKAPTVAALPPPVSIYFESGSAGLSGRAASDLDRMVDFLLKNPEARVTIKGYTDLTGSQNHNIRIAQSRADAAKDYLAKRGVAPARIQAVEMGAAKGSDRRQRPEDPKASRRAEIEVRSDSLTPSGTR
jgi:type II secretory pathway predicted ATPase ExeA/outer membrane protein OmpA-like peptidoglycan-associated protein